MRVKEVSDIRILLEHSQLRVFAVHPGILQQTETKRGMVVDAFTPFAHDKGIMTGGITLYLAGPAAGHLRGGFISANCTFVSIYHSIPWAKKTRGSR